MALLNLSKYDDADSVCAECFYFVGGQCTKGESNLVTTNDNEYCGDFSLYEVFYDDEIENAAIGRS